VRVTSTRLKDEVCPKLGRNLPWEKERKSRNAEPGSPAIFIE
jgi:hypothetical protein